MSPSNRGRSDPTTARTDAAPAASSPPPKEPDAYASWLERMQRARARHAAITRNLYTWSNYKTWADRMKNSWEEDALPPKK